MMAQGKTHGQQFLEILNVAKDDKSKMFTLLRSTLDKANPFPSEKVDYDNVINQVTDFDSVASMKAARAGFNARHGAFMFAEDYIYLTAKAYKDQGLGDVESFKKDFKNFVNNSHNGNSHAVENTVGILKQAQTSYAG